MRLPRWCEADHVAARILAIDQGTTNTKVLLVDGEGAVVARASRPVDITFPRPGWVEQDADVIWRTVTGAIDECLAQVDVGQLGAIAITNQRESVVVWDRITGAPVAPVVVWQCRRTAAICERLRAKGAGPLIASKTGLTIDPLFSATKLQWLLGHVPDGRSRAAAGDLCAGTIDSWLVWNLTGGAVHTCDTTNASRTQLCDLDSCTWDPALLDLFDVPRAVLPNIRPSSGVAGTTVAHGRLAADVPIAALIGDSHAALFGHRAFRPGAVKATYGTGSSLMTPTPARVDAAGLSSTVAWSFPDAIQYALEGNITDTGGAVDWAGRLLGSDRPDQHVAALAATVADSGGVYLVPAFAGLGAPYWDDRARGILCGLTRGAGPGEVARATVESIAYQVHDVFDVMTRAIGAGTPTLLADGGASRNDQLMQFQAEVLGVPVVRNTSSDLSAMGAAWLAGLATGVWRSVDDLERVPQSVDRFEPRMPASARERLLAGWREAVARARFRGGS
jgi:glycerol kinase